MKLSAMALLITALMLWIMATSYSIVELRDEVGELQRAVKLPTHP